MSHDRRALVAFVAAVLAFVAILLIAIFASSGGGDIEGSWTVESVVIDAETTRPIAGTTVTITFADGELSGSSGGNTYFGSYEVDGDSLTIGELGVTQMFCEDPNGVMDQESGYLALLSGAESFSLSGDILAIRVGGGDRIAYQRG